MFKLDRSETVLGRSSEAQFQVEDDGISRKHAKVVALGDGRFQLVDLGSTNGTYLNGLRVNTAPLYDGDKIQIGSNSVLKFSIQDQLEEQYQRSIYESATRDGLTRLYNKKYFMETMRKEFAYCLRHRVALSLVMFDVDHFKRVNDTYGHPVGDEVLVEIAKATRRLVRNEDVFARYGGEEFALILRGIALEGARVVGERLRERIASLSVTTDRGPVSVTVSVGCASVGSIPDANAESLVQTADRRLYIAKRAGRNRVVAADLPDG
jgi:diguanylate cyclase (GGDEF)-like protein